MSVETRKVRFGTRDGRRFGLLVGGLLLAVALLWMWRGRSTTLFAPVGAAGILLMLSGLVIPTRLAPLFRAWMGLATILSRVTTPIVLAIMYFLLITPMALLRRAIGGDPLIVRAGPEGFWSVRTSGRSKSMHRQF